MINRRKIIIFLFLCIICSPFILSTIHFATGQKPDVSLKGYFDEVTPPELTMDSYLDGQYQADYEAWLNANIIPRNIYIKLYNQIEFSCFDLGKVVIGSNDNLYDYKYIADSLGLNNYNYYNPSDQAKLINYVNQLTEIQDKLQKHNKHLALYITPSKAEYNCDDIPIQYTIQKSKDYLRPSDYLRELLRNTDIPYLDCQSLFASHEYPLFYSTGIHWARPIEQEASQALMELLKDISGKRLRNILLTSMNTSQAPYWRDADLFDLLNLYSSIPDITFYEYDSEKQYPESYEKARILLQGGSFAQGLIRDYFKLYTNDEVFYINYDNYIQDPNENLHTLDTWNDLDLGAYLDNVDFVVIELQEALTNGISDGFLDYLNEYLNTYVPNNTTSHNHDKNLDAVTQIGLSTNKGYYAYEANHIWTKENSSVTLKNPNITAKGMTLNLFIPELLLSQGNATLHIYVNQQKIDTVTVSTPGLLKLDYTGSLFSSDTDIYEIELYCDKSFTPSESSDSLDNRELSIAVQYIGEKK